MNDNMNEHNDYVPPVMGSKQVDAKAKIQMKSLMEKFSNVSASVAKDVAPYIDNPHSVNSNMLTEDQAYNVDVARALDTKRVETSNGVGMMMGSYAVLPSGPKMNKFKIQEVSSQETLIDNIYLFESADSIVKLLNKGYSKHSPEVASYSKLEENYQKHYNDAVSFKRRSKDAGQDMILETRFEEARMKAVGAKKQIIQLNSTLS